MKRVLAGVTICAAALLVLTSPAAALPSEFYGVTPATRPTDAEFERMERAKVRTVRLPVYWPFVQPDKPRRGDGKPAYLWHGTDVPILQAADHGIRIIPFVYGTPDWLAKKATTPPLRGKARRAWTKLLRKAANRYGRGGSVWKPVRKELDPKPVRAWQIWNEPNARDFWRQTPGAPKRYAKLLEISDGVLRRAAPGAKVLVGGLFGNPTHGMDMDVFLRQMYEVKGVARHFDAVGLHPYAPDLRRTTRQIRTAIQVMKRARDRQAGVWITELGWPTDGKTDNAFYKTRAEQAEILEQSFEAILEHRKAWRVQRLLWYTWRDNRVNRECSLCQYAGLLNSEGEPKPSFEAFLEFTGGRG